MLNKIACLKALDWLCGKLSCNILGKKEPAALPANVSRLLVIRPGGIGDAVLLAPALESIRMKFPHAQIMVLAERRNADVFRLVPGVDRLLRYDVMTELRSAMQIKPDIVIDTEQFHRLSAVFSYATGATVQIGYDTNERARLFNFAIPYSRQTYEVESFFRLLTPLGIQPPPSIPVPFLTMPDAILHRADQILEPLGTAPFVTIFPGASIPVRRWGAEHFRQVAVRLKGEGFTIVVVGGRADVAAGDVICRATNGLNLAGKTTLSETGAVLSRSKLLISGDSGVLHIGVGVGVPTVSFFGPGIAAKWAPKGRHHIVLNRHLPCSPCTKFGYTPRCPRNAACIAMIPPDDLFRSAMSLLVRS